MNTVEIVFFVFIMIAMFANMVIVSFLVSINRTMVGCFMDGESAYGAMNRRLIIEADKKNQEIMKLNKDAYMATKEIEDLEDEIKRKITTIYVGEVLK